MEKKVMSIKVWGLPILNVCIFFEFLTPDP